jgi:DNA-binding NarL/FixJ family response regulator
MSNTSNWNEQEFRSLTAREKECLEGLAHGLNNAGIAKLLHIALPTVVMHVSNARKKLGASTREQAVARAVHRGLVEP